MSRAFFGAALLAAVTSAAAQSAAVVPAASPTPLSTSARPSRQDPADARTQVPALSYRSAFAGYRPHAEQAVGAWKEANDTAGRIGGWRVYAREAQRADVARGAANVPPAAASAPTPVPTKRQDHGEHKTN